MIEHEPWVGPLFESNGISGQRLGVVGYSCWIDDDHPRYTIESVENVISGTWPNVHFFNAIPSYFGMNRAEFYNRVVMFEFVPCSIGGGQDRYASATAEQAEAGRERTLRIAKERAIDKLLFFSGKAWNSMPPTIERAAGNRLRLGETRFECGHFPIGERHVSAIGLRHPQYAPKALMVSAVEQAMALPLERM
jgi:hypothetical protein